MNQTGDDDDGIQVAAGHTLTVQLCTGEVTSFTGMRVINTWRVIFRWIIKCHLIRWLKCLTNCPLKFTPILWAKEGELRIVYLWSEWVHHSHDDQVDRSGDDCSTSTSPLQRIICTVNSLMEQLVGRRSTRSLHSSRLSDDDVNCAINKVNANECALRWVVFAQDITLPVNKKVVHT